jgi:hypothetical protein
MLLLERVREIGADEARVEEDTVRVARQALLREVARSARPERVRRPHRRAWAGFGIGALVAGAAVTAIVVGSVVMTPVPDVAAAAVLESAAEVTVGAQDTQLEPGQFLRIETQGEYLQFWDAAWADDDDETTFAFNASRERADAAVLVRDSRVLYVPADRSGDWFFDWGTADVVKSFGDRGAEAAEQFADWPAARGRESGTIQTLPAGEFVAPDGDTPPQPYLADAYRPYYTEMPREPEELLDWLRARSGMSGVEADRWLVAGLSDPSSINLMPPDLRAAFFRAIAMIPGFEVVSIDDDLATLRYAVSGHRTTTIAIDTEHGLVESIAEGYGTEGVTGDVPESVIRVITTVVDSAPDPR